MNRDDDLADLAALVQAHFARQAGKPEEPTVEEITGGYSFQPRDASMWLVADGLRKTLQNRDLKRMVEGETEPDKLRLFLVADCLLQYQASPEVKRHFLSRLRKGTSLEEAVRYLSIADFFNATIQRIGHEELISLTRAADTLSAAQQIAPYLFTDYYLSLLSRDGRDGGYDAALSMLREGKDIGEIARYAAQRTALHELCSGLETPEAIERIGADPREGLKALLLMDYCLSHTTDTSARQRIAEFLNTNPSLDKAAIYASTTFLSGKLITRLNERAVAAGIAEPTIENIQALLVIDYVASHIGRGDITDLLNTAASSGKPLDAVADMAALALSRRLSPQQIEALTKSVVIPALTEQLRGEIQRSSAYLARQEQNRQLREAARISIGKTISNWGIGVAASAVVAAIGIGVYWFVGIYAPTAISEQNNPNLPYAAVAEPADPEIEKRLSIEYGLVSSLISPDHARQEYIKRLKDLKEKTEFWGWITGQSQGVNPDEIAGLEYVLSQDTIFVGREQLRYFRENKYDTYLRYVELLEKQLSSLVEAERSLTPMQEMDELGRGARITATLKTAMTTYGITDTASQDRILFQTGPNIDEIVRQQDFMYTALEAMKQQNISPSSRNLTKEQKGIVGVYNTSRDAIRQNTAAILEATVR